MIHKPRVSSEVAGHGDIRIGVFMECDSREEAEAFQAGLQQIADGAQRHNSRSEALIPTWEMDEAADIAFVKLISALTSER